ncbi:DUF616 domain-containing protein [Rhizobium sp. S152]|uniref:glycosyltransferase domain-containing protein n=1 Tax=Rhizobium sp. S152 TaxID=3055038 RepID=UPI0025AA11E7|nr:glycosyltransferase domain-containing protein [Rhizobium sp. S152]MDM9628411.1 DUF616 domain-containing protein [Rhizobium sp. S152]
MQEASNTEYQPHAMGLDLEEVGLPEEDRIAVYTAIFAGYDDIPALENIDDRLDYFIFTDGDIDAPPPWQVRKLTPVFRDPQRDARRVKLLPHLFLPGKYTISVWIDSSLSIRNLTSEIVEQVLGDQDIAVTRHSQRNCIYAEAKAVLDVNYDSPGRVDRQMRQYANRGFPAAFGLHATMFLVRRHTKPNCIAYDLDWWSQLSRFSKRDQLSFDYVRWRNPGTSVRTLEMNHGNNQIFGFKMKDGREHKSSNRVTDEHLETALRSASGLAYDAADSYSDLYDSYSQPFLAHLRNINQIGGASDTAQLDSICYYAGQPDYLYSPPAPGKGKERELLLRAIAGRQRLFAMSLDGGYDPLLVLSETNLAVTSLDDGEAPQNETAAAYLRANFEDRFLYARLDAMTLLDIIDQISFDLYDAILVNAARRPELVIYDLVAAATHGAPGAVVVVTHLGNIAVKRAITHLASRGLIEERGDLSAGTAVAYTIRKRTEAAPNAAELLADINAIRRSLGTGF